jgi:peptidoglycan/LPS O-acetylase OafA/YrhL
MPGRVFEFTLGMALAYLMRGGSRGPLPAWLLSQPLLAVIVVACVMAACVSKTHLGVTHPLTDLSWSCAFAALFWWASRPGVAQRLLSWSPLVLMGTASYSIYLVHQFLLGSVTRACLWPLDSSFTRVAMLPVAVLITASCCGLFYLLIERPAITLFRGLDAKRRALTGVNDLAPRSA